MQGHLKNGKQRKVVPVDIFTNAKFKICAFCLINISSGRSRPKKHIWRADDIRVVFYLEEQIKNKDVTNRIYYTLHITHYTWLAKQSRRSTEALEGTAVLRLTNRRCILPKLLISARCYVRAFAGNDITSNPHRRPRKSLTLI